MMKVWYKKSSFGSEYIKISYYIKVSKWLLYTNIQRKRSNKKRFKPEKMLIRRGLVFTPKPTPCPFTDLPYFYIEDNKIELSLPSLSW